MRLRVFSRRWGHEGWYQVEKTATGWNIGNKAIRGACDKSGEPYLFENFRQDAINCPSNLGLYFEWLWDKADASGITDGEIQDHLSALATWVRETERSAPEGGVWAGLSPTTRARNPRVSLKTAPSDVPRRRGASCVPVASPRLRPTPKQLPGVSLER